MASSESASERDEPQIIFFADEDVSGTAIQIARAQGVNIITMHDVGLRTIDDDSIPFYYAVEHEYVLITGNARDFEPLFGDFLATGRNHPGLIIIRPGVRQLHRYIAQELITYYRTAISIEDFKDLLINIQ